MASTATNTSNTTAANSDVDNEEITHWLAEDIKNNDNKNNQKIVNCLCLGTGRFLRSVLVPPIIEMGYNPVLIQTRGRSFMDYMATTTTTTTSSQQEGKYYEIDTVLPTTTETATGSSRVETSLIKCYGAFSLGSKTTSDAFWKTLPKIVNEQTGISMIGIGVTEAGLSSYDTTVMKNLYEILVYVCNQRKSSGIWPSSSNNNNNKLVVIDMDNVPNNGDTIYKYMIQQCHDHDDNNNTKDIDMVQFINDHVVVLNTMVDRITSQREGSNGLIPRCEPIPSKALVVLDPNDDWNNNINSNDDDANNRIKKKYGVVIRSTKEQLDVDIALKLRIANGTHTAIAHLLALEGYLETNTLSDGQAGKLFMKYLDVLVEKQIIPATQLLLCTNNNEEASEVYDDWRKRLIHPSFGLSTFFITQNGPSKGGIRWGPTVMDLINHNIPIQISFAFAYAVLLRWLTPLDDQSFTDCNSNTIYTGWLQNFGNINNTKEKPTLAGILKIDNNDCNTTIMYADGLRYNLQQGWYEYKCPVVVDDDNAKQQQPLVKLLQESARQEKKSDADCLLSAIRGYLFASDGGNLGSCSSNSSAIDDLVQAIAILYTRLVGKTGDGGSLMNMLRELESSKDGIGFESPCHVLLTNVSSETK